MARRTEFEDGAVEGGLEVRGAASLPFLTDFGGGRPPLDWRRPRGDFKRDLRSRESAGAGEERERQFGEGRGKGEGELVLRFSPRD